MIAALCVAALMPACMFVSQTESLNSEGDTTSAAAGGSQGAGGSQADGSVIEIGPDSGDSGQSDPSKPFAYLCAGDGDCVIGSSCSGGEAGGPVQPMACELVPDLGVAVAECAPAGTFNEGEPCNSADNCAAGLGCAATPNGGVCRSYCCGDAEQCPASTYCDPQPMAEDTINKPQLLIPVCIPATNCELLNDEMTCPDSLTCTIVRADGTTSCVVPGPNTLNEPCPCAAGYVCSKLSHQCIKLCHIGQDEVDCAGTGSCLGGSLGYPAGFGVCSPASN